MERANNKQDNFGEEQSWENLILPDIYKKNCYKVIKAGIMAWVYQPGLPWWLRG